MLKFLRIIFRVSLLLTHILGGLLLSLIFLTPPNKRFGFYPHKRLIRQWLAVTCYFAGCKVTTNNKTLNKPTLVIANHVSWLDILVMGGQYELTFLSKEEVKKWPVFGFLLVSSETMLIKRGTGSEGAITEMKQKLSEGNAVCFYPEATTSSGFATKRFHSRLFRAAYESDSSVTVASLSYSTDEKGRDYYMGWEKQSFYELLFYILGQKRSYAQLNLISEISDYQQLKRKELAKKCQQLIDDDLESNHYPCDKQHQ